MENFITWVSTNWMAAGLGLFFVLSAVGQFVGLFDGPDPDDGTSKTLKVVDRLLGILRSVGIGTYKNEPGTVSMPFKGDSKKRVTATKDV